MNAYTDYELMNDLDFEGDASYSDPNANKAAYGGKSTGSGWLPIGYYIGTLDNAPFRSTFDGGRHVIDNLYMNRSGTTTTARGLFAYTTGTTRNVGLTNVNITAVTTSTRFEIGGLAGRQFGGTLRNCYFSGGTSTGPRMLGVRLTSAGWWGLWFKVIRSVEQSVAAI